MASFVAFELDDEKLLVAVGAVARNLTIKHTFDIKLDEEDTEVEIGERLRRWLNSHGVNKCEALGIVSRSQSEIREVTVPPAPDDELPDLVRFQAKNDFATFTDQWALDFVPFTNDPAKPRQVLAAAIAPEKVEQLTQICDAANVKLKRILFRPYAAADLLSVRTLDGRPRILVDETGEETDISLIRGNELIGTRTVRIPGGEDEQQRNSNLIREIRRTIASLSQRIDRDEIKEVVICGESDETSELLESSCNEQLKVDTLVVKPFDYVTVASKFDTPDDAQNYTALLGALSREASADRHAIDFLNPRQRVVNTTDFSKYIRIAAIAAMGFLLLGLIGWWNLRVQQQQIAEMQKQVSSLKAKNASEDDPANSVDTLMADVEPFDEFLCELPNWLNELYEVSGRMRTPDDIIVDKFEAGLGSGEGRITLSGRVVTDKEPLINKDLIQRPYKQVHATKEMKLEDDPTFNKSFGYQIMMDHSAPERIKKKINELAEELLKSELNQTSE